MEDVTGVGVGVGVTMGDSLTVAAGVAVLAATGVTAGF